MFNRLKRTFIMWSNLNYHWRLLLPDLLPRLAIHILSNDVKIGIRVREEGIIGSHKLVHAPRFRCCHWKIVGGRWIGFRIVWFHRKNCSDFGSGEYFTRIFGSYLIQRIADLSNILARIVDLACNLVRILDCDFIVELLAYSNLDKTIVGSRILLQIWADRLICIPLFTPPPLALRVGSQSSGTTFSIWIKTVVWIHK
jgi:hypothetical protein